MNDIVLQRIVKLKTTPLSDLKKMWRDFFDADPPTYNRSWLEGRLAYKIQELHHGGLKASTIKHLEELGEQLERDQKNATGRRTDFRPLTGTKLIREFQGVNHEVIVKPDYFEYQGQPFKSLSSIARAITGTSWNGPVFFGLRPARRKS